MPVQPPHPSLLRVYFDGLCPLCSREIDYYRKQKGADRVQWIDITLAGFDALKEGLDPDRIHAVFHVKTPTGQILTGVDGFIEIWRSIPSLGKWARISGVPGARPAMKIGYAVFARIRPYLPRRSHEDCDTGLCTPQRGKTR